MDEEVTKVFTHSKVQGNWVVTLWEQNYTLRKEYLCLGLSNVINHEVYFAQMLLRQTRITYTSTITGKTYRIDHKFDCGEIFCIPPYG